MRPKLFYRLPFLCSALFLIGAMQLTAQTLNKPIPADNPNLPGNSAWTAACASSSFNEYFVNFTWGPPLVNGDNEFILELSDASGNFGSPVELARLNDKNTNFDFEFQFAVPTGTRGDNYRFRVRSTSPAVTGTASDPYPMYYIDFNSPILISQNGDGIIPPGGTLEVCNGNSVTLAVHNVPSSNTYQYNWYRSATLLSEKSSSITVNQAGMYNVEIDYGTICSGSANTLSNTIDITLGTSLGIAINPPAKTVLCSGETVDLIANITGFGLTYVWYKDGVAITPPTIDDDTYTVDSMVVGFEGDYQVEIDGPGTCLERSVAVTISNAGSFTVTRGNTANIVLLPSQTETLSVTTTASSPIYQWYKDGSPIGGATNSTLDVSQAGIYFARVSESSGPCGSTIDSETTTAVLPASFELVIDYASAYTACENTSISLNLNSINAVAGDGSKTDVTASLLSSFTYQWKKDGVNVGGETSGIINLTNISENGDYTLDGVLNTYTPSSNMRAVQLLVNETLAISSSSMVSCDPTEIISISTTTDLSTENFDWFKDGVNLNDANEILGINQPGTYQLVVTKNGCPLRSNELTISPLDESLISLDTPDDVVFPEGSSRTVTASGGTAYGWYDASNTLVSNTASLTLNEEGTYVLVANIESCVITKPLTVTYLDTFKVPNVITVNGDGINDQWVIPNSYSRNLEINIIIYDEKGVEILNEFDYQNNWPQSSTAFQKQNMVFFYKIRNANEVLKQGTITVIR